MKTILVLFLLLLKTSLKFHNIYFVQCLSLSSSPASFTVHKVPIIKSPSDFDVHRHYFHTSSVFANANNDKKEVIYETPVLIENVLSSSTCEDICDSLMNNLGHVPVQLQQKEQRLDPESKPETNIYDVPLYEAFDYVMDSQYENSFFSFSEGLLNYYDNCDDEDERGTVMKNIKDILNSSKETLFGNSIQTNKSWNLFDNFPEHIKPSDCVVIAGEGATSTLHRDPFCWTGTSLCLEGTKVWRFIAPPVQLGNYIDDDVRDDDSGVTLIDDVLNAYRLPSVAWDSNSITNEEEQKKDPTYLSSGWQSDYSLYSTPKADIPSAEEFGCMDKNRKVSILKNLAENLNVLSPTCNQKHSLAIWTVVQKPGDLLVIPAYWWHQTFAFEPSLAIASQRCGAERDCKRVLKHMFETSGLDAMDDIPAMFSDMNDNKSFNKYTPKEIVDELLKLLSNR
mmetsp:Transcript_14955/g.17399  ORF Transcript_14955/g.17399 Transcript_14955/m.17399 type:complete len:452 (-) Transcript_14955:26-1381(-)